jgi:polyhydroxyalkanoate synthesis regulator protein
MDTRKFVKYGNRKIYDCDECRYTSMENVAAIVRLGHDIEVVEDQTGDDVTVSVLGRLVYDLSRSEGEAFERKDMFELIRKSKSAVPAKRPKATRAAKKSRRNGAAAAQAA